MHRAGVRSRAQAKRRHVAATWHLDENGATRLQRVVRRSQRNAGQPRGERPGVSLLLDVVAGGRDPRCRGPHGRAIGDDLVRPAGFDQQGGLGRAGESADQQRRATERRAQDEHVARVRIGGPRLGVQVVAVVPDREQADVGDRGERRGPGADDRPDVTPAHREPAPVAFGRPEIGRESYVATGAEHVGQRRVQAGEVAMIRDDDDRPPTGCQCGVRRLGQSQSPLLAGK